MQNLSLIYKTNGSCIQGVVDPAPGYLIRFLIEREQQIHSYHLEKPPPKIPGCRLV